MNFHLKSQIYDALEKVIDNNCDDAPWPHLIHDKLLEQMTNAAELIFDSAQDAQEFNRQSI